MLGMPVATLRVWERRYGLTRTTLTRSGQRLYSADDVQRLALIRQLTEHGHAIGTLARLDMAQLHRVASRHAQTVASTHGGDGSHIVPAPFVLSWRLAVIGDSLGSRLQRPALLRRLGRPVVLLGVFDSVAQAAAALQGSPPDVLVVHEPQLHEGWLAAAEAAAPDFVEVQKAVLYGFAPDSACDALATAGVALLREPQPDTVIAQWLGSLSTRPNTLPRLAVDPEALGAEAVRPRRWDDAALTDFANLSPAISCECPRHVAELLMQLSHFEEYSAACQHRNAADADLHAFLRRVAATSRICFEAALEHVALHEGLLLPTPANAYEPSGRRTRAAASGNR